MQQSQLSLANVGPPLLTRGHLCNNKRRSGRAGANAKLVARRDMARFLITCWSFPGHVFQPLAVARVLRERGHECAFYSGPRAARVVEGEGFPLFQSGKAEEDA